jgi:PAS domain-containing protein
VLMQFTELPVKEIETGDRIEPDHVFIVPAGMAVKLESTQFVLERVCEPGALRTTIDNLFRCLADAYGSRAAGIVLSGAGRDGTFGVQMIAHAGGMTFAHDPAQSHCDSMPRSAIASGVIDYVLSPFEMPERLLAHTDHGAELIELSISHRVVEQTVQDLQAENQELQRLNRELLGVHGKLHATVQELRSQLAEAQLQDEALRSAHTNLSSLLCETPIALVLLDEDLNLRGFTEDATQLYDIQTADVGSALALLPHRAHEMPALPTPSELRAAHGTHEADVITAEHWYLRRALPHYTRQGEADGMVVAFIDVTKLKSSEANANPHEAWLRSITDAMPSIVSYVDEAVQRQ